MTTPLLVVPDDDPALFAAEADADLARLAPMVDVRRHRVRWRDRAEFLERMEAAELVINVRAYSRFDAEVLAHAPNLRLISVVGTGVDNIDLEAARSRGITVCNTPGVASEAVAELALGLLLDVARQISRTGRELAAGRWQHHVGLELRGRTLGLVGLGSIGRHLARLAQGLGMHVIAWNRSTGPLTEMAGVVEPVTFDQVFRNSHVVSVHLRSTPETAGMVDRRSLELLRRGAIVINTARAAVVDYRALADLLRSGRLGGAGLDVHPQEPLSAEANLFAGIENAVLTPHIGSVTEDANRRSAAAAVDNVLAFLAGSPTNVVVSP